MNDLLKGAAIAAVVLIVLIAVNVFCNMNGLNLESVSTGTISAVCAMLLFRGLTKKDKISE